MKVIYQRGYAINKRVSAVINSANGFLLLGTSGAGAIREKSQPLTKKEQIEYNTILRKLPKKLQNDYQRTFKKHRWTPTYAQLGCLKILLAKKGNEVKRGDAVLQTGWSKKDKRPIIHAVSMSYKLSLNSSERLRATENTIKNAISKALKLADSTGATSVATPVCAARPTYGLTPKGSLAAIRKAIRATKMKNIKKIVICFDNRLTKQYYGEIKAK